MMRENQTRADMAEYSNLYPLVVSPVAIPSPTRHLLLSESMVVSSISLMAGHVDRLHLHRTGILQHRILDSTHEQHREYSG